MTGCQVVAAAQRLDDVRQSVAPGRVRLVNVRVAGDEANVLAGMRATLGSDRPILLCEVRFAATEADGEAERLRKERLQDVLAEQDYVILQLVINRQGDMVGAARMDQFPLGPGSAATPPSATMSWCPGSNSAT